MRIHNKKLIVVGDRVLIKVEEGEERSNVISTDALRKNIA